MQAIATAARLKPPMTPMAIPAPITMPPKELRGTVVSMSALYRLPRLHLNRRDR